MAAVPEFAHDKRIQAIIIADDLGNKCEVRMFDKEMGFWSTNKGDRTVRAGDLILLTSVSSTLLATYNATKYFRLTAWGPIFHHRSSDGLLPEIPGAINFSEINWREVMAVSPIITVDTALEIVYGTANDPEPQSKYKLIRDASIIGIINVFQLRNKEGEELLECLEIGKVRKGLDGIQRDLEDTDLIRYKLKLEISGGGARKLIATGWNQAGIDLFGITARELFLWTDDKERYDMITELKDWTLDILVQKWQKNTKVGWTVHKILSYEEEQESSVE